MHKVYVSLEGDKLYISASVKIKIHIIRSY